ncbi:MAG TPA: peptidoglycan DD-metalloendopeptidase family protein [Sphingomicrobium sp.]|nr:peptidoglycan DD-metalloendopeptidase family protein [Sphingomicrobium sp.]
MRVHFALLAIIPALASASVPLGPPGEPIDAALKAARAEASAAEARAKQLEQVAANARSEVERLRAGQLAAGEAIAAAEARITAADAELAILSASIAERRKRFAEQQQPLASLLAGLAVMAQRPPLLAIADSKGADELLQVQLLVEATMPVIRERTAALAADLEHGRRLELGALAARRRLADGRDTLALRQREFAALEAKAWRAAVQTQSEALNAGDVAVAAAEETVRVTGEGRRARSSAQIAAELAALGPAPQRPGGAVGGSARAPLDYVLPADAPVADGFGSISSGGIRSRGLKLATARATPVAVPASGIVRFAGPFRSHDGIVIIDHGRGWMSLIINVSTAHRRGAQVRAGEPLGRALGPIVVELSHNGRWHSPALIAGSSASLSNKREDG